MKELKDIFKKGFDKEGRPRIVETPEQLKDGVNSYYNSIIKTRVTEEGEEIKYFYRPTITGLALHLGYATRQSIYYNQSNDDEFCYILKKATTFIEQYHEESLDSKNVAGHVFALKNMGWSDKTEIETKEVKDESIDLSKLSDEEIGTYEELLKKGSSNE